MVTYNSETYTIIVRHVTNSDTIHMILVSNIHHEFIRAYIPNSTSSK